MTKTAVAEKVTPAQKTVEVRDRPKRTYDPNRVADVYLKTSTGVIILIGKDGDEVREHIEDDKNHSPLDYRFFDDDRKRWAYWAVKDDGGAITPPAFPAPLQYSLTSQQLYTKAVTYPHILAHAVGLLKEKPPTLWDKMLKPTTIIIAIVAIVFVMGLILMALTGK
jgi:hypothetical protein